VWLVSLPIQAAAVSSLSWSWVVWFGCLVWAVGLLFETVGDAQLASYKRDPQRPPVLDRGLWSWSRHPNYFGDALVWWGLWLVGGLASGWLPALASVTSPAAMTVWLVWVTGARLLERTMMTRPGYPEYAARTSMFVPLPPRRRI
jgi:steroid 5-alpha reductase family enzyme